MTTPQQRITALAQAVGADVKTLETQIGALPNLNTAVKTSLVEALNEVIAGSKRPNVISFFMGQLY